MRHVLPTGTVTFLFTDVEGSTRLLHELGAEAYAEALAGHRRIVREACAFEGGVEVDTQGDAFFFSFVSASEAVAAAQAIRDGLAASLITLRLGLHTGTPLVTDEGYVGDDVHLAARVGAAAHGGQVVLSKATRELVDGLSFTDLGEHRLKDIAGPVSIFQLGSEGFPPLKTISNTNLPRPASSFVGREEELENVLAQLESGARLLTLTGPGGSGKTRLALEAATTLVPSYKAGVFWIGLSALREPALVTETIALTLGATGGLAEHIAERELLLLLDNLEQVIEAGPELGELVRACPNLALLVTSRELLRVQGEVEYPVPPLASTEAVSLFCERARLEPNEEIAELCARLDNLPLAVELAAARTKALSPKQILERIGQRLDLLKGGRDADPRQLTLRATIEWSYDLLSEEEQRLFRALSVFAGCTLDAAEDVCASDVETLQSLVEKSLIRFTNERYWMLETIREYALERLGATNAGVGHGLRHARYYLARLEENDPLYGPRIAELLAWFGREEDNLRAMLDALAGAAPLEAVRAAYLLRGYWVGRGAISEGQQRVRALLTEAGDLPDAQRSRLAECLSELEERLGNLGASDALAKEALALAEAAGDREILVDALRSVAWSASIRLDAAEAVRLGRRGLEEAAALQDRRRVVRAFLDLGSFLMVAGDYGEAVVALQDALEGCRSLGDVANEATCLANLGALYLWTRDWEHAQIACSAALEKYREIGHFQNTIYALLGLGWSELGLSRRETSRTVFSEALSAILALGMTGNPVSFEALGCIALAADPSCFKSAARLRGAVARFREASEYDFDHRGLEIERLFEQPLIDALGEEAFEREQAIGGELSLDDAVALAQSLADASIGDAV